MTSSEQGIPHDRGDNVRNSLKEFLSKTNGKLPDQPSRDEISRKQNSLDWFTAGRKSPEATMASNLALKFDVCNLSGKSYFQILLLVLLYFFNIMLQKNLFIFSKSKHTTKLLYSYIIILFIKGKRVVIEKSF